ncbi:MAG TPA: MBL fold metallo-hydrolase, partial [Pseudobdellovibrionaceae bacterium]
QNVDYEYQENLKPPSTAEISCRFAPLTAEQTQRVYDYCSTGLLERYNSMDPPGEPYFNKPRIWRLSVYDHAGQVRHFCYGINSGLIEPAEEEVENISWTTEVPIAKLFAALEAGESLTSMYLRINDMVFPPNIEEGIQSADIVEDPLIRCLFNGVFGAYQIAQLKRLKFAVF